MASSSNTREDKEDTFVILVATDCHLGYAEKDPVRGNDSMKSFEEILKIAKENDVDMILLGGDLFHNNKPSRKCIHDCLMLLRKYCLGDRPVAIEFLSDQSEDFKSNAFPFVNYEDPNLNVSIPVFSIHGNHDDPTGSANMSSLDLLSVTGLINYFGKCTNLESIAISPLLMQKGQSKIAVYGLGSIRDERLHRMFREGKVTTLRSKENGDAWFNVFVIHQNRVPHGPKNYIPGHFLDDYLDLVIWGHEHECRLEPEWEEWPNHKGFYISQPGSSIATSLCPGEAVPKHVGLLQIKGKSFKMSQIPLKTVRQFYFENVNVSDAELNKEDPKYLMKLQEFLKEKVDVLLEKARLDRLDNEHLPEKPLIRLRVEITDQAEKLNITRFGQLYVNKVANPKDILLYAVKRLEKIKETDNFDMEQLSEYFRNCADIVNNKRVEDIVKEYFQSADDKLKLSLLSENGIGVAVEEYVDKQVREAISDMISHQTKKVFKHLQDENIQDCEVDKAINEYRTDRMKNVEGETAEAKIKMQESRSRDKGAINENNEEHLSSDLEDENDNSTTRGRTTTRGRGRGRGRGKNQSARGGKKKGADFDDDESLEFPTPKRGRGRGRASVAASTRGRQRSVASIFDKGGAKNGVDECIIVEDDSDEDFRATTSKRASNNSSAATPKKRSIDFSSDDSI